MLTTTTTIPGRSADGVDAVVTIVGDALEWVGDQAVLTQGRCVDVLLDIYCAYDDELVRWFVTEFLSDIRFLHSVEGEEMRTALETVAALALDCFDVPELVLARAA